MTSLISRFESRLDLHQSPMHAETMAGIGWQTLGKPGNQIFLKQLGPFSTAKLQRPQTIDVEYINAFRKQHKTLFFYTEPGLNNTVSTNLGRAVEPFSHSVTSLVDLKQTEKALLSSFHQKTRYNIRLTLRKKEISIKTFPLNKLTKSSRNDFYSLRKNWSKRKHIYGYEYDFIKAIITSYKDHGWIHLAYQDAIPVAALLVLENDSVATYYSAFSSLDGYKSFAPTLLTWVSMQNAKKNGCDIYDFGGIYDARYPRLYKKWQGFTKFKDGFSPTVVEYPTTHLKLFW